jgi:hypothetical protein
VEKILEEIRGKEGEKQMRKRGNVERIKEKYF